VDRDQRVADCHELASIWRGENRGEGARELKHSSPWDPSILMRAASLGGGEPDSDPMGSLAQNAITTLDDSGLPMPIGATETMEMETTKEDAPKSRLRIWFGLSVVGMGAVVAVLLVGLIGVMGTALYADFGGTPSTKIAERPISQVPAPEPVSDGQPATHLGDGVQTIEPELPIKPPPSKVVLVKPPREATVEQEPEENVPPSNTASVKASGDARQVRLQSDQGTFGPGDVPAGTYRVKVIFPNLGAVDVGELHLDVGQHVELVCEEALRRCW
jgi:hypothetical protein